MQNDDVAINWCVPLTRSRGRGLLFPQPLVKETGTGLLACSGEMPEVAEDQRVALLIGNGRQGLKN